MFFFSFSHNCMSILQVPNTSEFSNWNYFLYLSNGFVDVSVIQEQPMSIFEFGYCKIVMETRTDTTNIKILFKRFILFWMWIWCTLCLAFCRIYDSFLASGSPLMETLRNMLRKIQQPLLNCHSKFYWSCLWIHVCLPWSYGLRIKLDATQGFC
jgi:hypothetical protein